MRLEQIALAVVEFLHFPYPKFVFFKYNFSAFIGAYCTLGPKNISRLIPTIFSMYLSGSLLISCSFLPVLMQFFV